MTQYRYNCRICNKDLIHTIEIKPEQKPICSYCDREDRKLEVLSRIAVALEKLAAPSRMIIGHKDMIGSTFCPSCASYHYSSTKCPYCGEEVA